MSMLYIFCTLVFFTELQEHSGKVSDLPPVSLFSVVLNPNPQQH